MFKIIYVIILVKPAVHVYSVSPGLTLTVHVCILAANANRGAALCVPDAVQRASSGKVRRSRGDSEDDQHAQAFV